MAKRILLWALVIAAMLLLAAVIIFPSALAFSGHKNYQTKSITAEAKQPEDVVKDFYTWYIEYIGDDFTRPENNPLLDGAYKERPDLSPEFVARVAAHAAKYESNGFDPILMAMFIPDRIEVLSSTTEADKAEVVVNRYWSKMVDKPLPMRVLLQQVKGRWLIDNVSLIMTTTNQAPAETIEAFYIWDLSYIGSLHGQTGNIVTEKAYRNSPQLTTAITNRVDKLLASFNDASGYDPFFCAQIVPISINIEAVFMHTIDEEGIQTASAVVRTPHFNHTFTIDLELQDDRWLIDNISCGFTPAGTTQAFYTWYLAYFGDRSSGEMRNPLVDGAYQDCGFLSEEFIQELDFLVATGFQADPILMAQDIPQDFIVEPGEENGTAIVYLYFGPDSTRRLKVSLTEELGAWKIIGIVLAE